MSLNTLIDGHQEVADLYRRSAELYRKTQWAWAQLGNTKAEARYRVLAAECDQKASVAETEIMWLRERRGW